MRIRFWGAAQTVTGSMHLLEFAGKRVKQCPVAIIASEGRKQLDRRHMAWRVANDAGDAVAPIYRSKGSASLLMSSSRIVALRVAATGPPCSPRSPWRQTGKDTESEEKSSAPASGKWRMPVFRWFWCSEIRPITGASALPGKRQSSRLSRYLRNGTEPGNSDSRK